jgi:hypothetical protein
MANLPSTLQSALRKNLVQGIKWMIGCLYLLIGTPGYSSKLITFVFHEVSDNPRGHALLTNTYSTHKNFLKQICLLRSNFEFIDPRGGSAWAESHGCLITFDDGYKGALEATKVLRNLGVASIHFVNLETIYGRPNSSAALHFKAVHTKVETNWKDSNPSANEKLMSGFTDKERKDLAEFSGPYINPKELKEMMSFGGVVLGDHFLNHWYGNNLASDEILENLALNSNQYTEIQEMKPYFAAPHGRMSTGKMEVISEQGYDVIFSGSVWMKLGNTNVLPRINMNNSIKSKASLFGAIAILMIRNKRKTRS